jgi:hypothetical protein
LAKPKCLRSFGLWALMAAGYTLSRARSSSEASDQRHTHGRIPEAQVG